MRELSAAEYHHVAGGTGYQPTPTQVSHGSYQRPTSFENWMNDRLLQGSEALGTDMGMTTWEREQALGQMYDLNDLYQSGSNRWYSGDGVTTLYDDDNDGSPDTALRTVNGSTYIFGPQGWGLF